jgi:hypothetical protein
MFYGLKVNLQYNKPMGISKESDAMIENGGWIIGIAFGTRLPQ